MDEQVQLDQKYIKALKERDPVLCQEIYKLFLPKVVAMIKKQGGNEQEAKEVFQQAILAILSNLKTKNIVLAASFGAYIKSISYNKFIDLCRKQKKILRNKEDLRLSGETLQNSEAVDQLLIKEKQLNLIWQCFEKLKDDCRKIINGKLDGFTASSIMQQINFKKPANAFYQKRFDCMRKLKDCIQQHPEYAMLKI